MLCCSVKLICYFKCAAIISCVPMLLSVTTYGILTYSLYDSARSCLSRILTVRTMHSVSDAQSSSWDGLVRIGTVQISSTVSLSTYLMDLSDPLERNKMHTPDFVMCYLQNELSSWVHLTMLYHCFFISLLLVTVVSEQYLFRLIITTVLWTSMRLMDRYHRVRALESPIIQDFVDELTSRGALEIYPDKLFDHSIDWSFHLCGKFEKKKFKSRWIRKKYWKS